MLQLDHITIAAESLRAGVAHAEAALGVSIPFGGGHPLMGTHNHLLRLGGTLFLEIIAPDPAAGPLPRRRWFSLDDPALRAELAISPRLLTWVVATDDIETALRQVPYAAGPAIMVTRGELEWLISVPPDGAMPFDGTFPTIIGGRAVRIRHPACRTSAAASSRWRLRIPRPRRSADRYFPSWAMPGCGFRGRKSRGFTRPSVLRRANAN